MLELIGELRAQAQDLAARVYAEKPNAYGRRLGAYMHAADDMSTSALGT